MSKINTLSVGGYDPFDHPDAQVPLALRVARFGARMDVPAQDASTRAWRIDSGSAGDVRGAALWRTPADPAGGAQIRYPGALPIRDLPAWRHGATPAVMSRAARLPDARNSGASSPESGSSSTTRDPGFSGFDAGPFGPQGSSGMGFSGLDFGPFGSSSSGRPVSGGGGKPARGIGYPALTPSHHESDTRFHAYPLSLGQFVPSPKHMPGLAARDTHEDAEQLAFYPSGYILGEDGAGSGETASRVYGIQEDALDHRGRHRARLHSMMRVVPLESGTVPFEVYPHARGLAWALNRANDGIVGRGLVIGDASEGPGGGPAEEEMEPFGGFTDVGYEDSPWWDPEVNRQQQNGGGRQLVNSNAPGGYDPGVARRYNSASPPSHRNTSGGGVPATGGGTGAGHERPLPGSSFEGAGPMLACMSRVETAGPLVVGDPEDEHLLAPGNTSGHLSPDSYWHHPLLDAPMAFEHLPYDYPEDLDYPVAVHFRAGFADTHPHPAGAKGGLWRWQSSAGMALIEEREEEVLTNPPRPETMPVTSEAMLAAGEGGDPLPMAGGGGGGGGGGSGAGGGGGGGGLGGYIGAAGAVEWRGPQRSAIIPGVPLTQGEAEWGARSPQARRAYAHRALWNPRLPHEAYTAAVDDVRWQRPTPHGQVGDPAGYGRIPTRPPTWALEDRRPRDRQRMYSRPRQDQDPPEGGGLTQKPLRSVGTVFRARSIPESAWPDVPGQQRAAPPQHATWYEHYAPATMRAEAFAAADGLGWIYGRQPGWRQPGRYLGGTSANGGVVHLPPEQDVAGVSVVADADVVNRESYWRTELNAGRVRAASDVYYSTTRLAWGTPDVRPNGSAPVRRGWTSRAGSGNLIFTPYTSAGVAETAGVQEINVLGPMTLALGTAKWQIRPEATKQAFLGSGSSGSSVDLSLVDAQLEIKDAGGDVASLDAAVGYWRVPPHSGVPGADAQLTGAATFAQVGGLWYLYAWLGGAWKRVNLV